MPRTDGEHEYLTGTLHATFESRGEVGKHRSSCKLHGMRFAEPIVRDAEWSDAPVVRGAQLFEDTLDDGIAAARVLTRDGVVRDVERLESVRLSDVRLVNVHKVGERMVGEIEARLTATRRIIVSPPPVVIARPVITPTPTLTADVEELRERDVWKPPVTPRAVDRTTNSALDSGVGCATKSLENIVALLLFAGVMLAVLWVASAVFSFVYDILTAAWDRTGIGSLSPDLFPSPVSGWARWWGQHMHPLGQILVVVFVAYVLWGWRKVSRWRSR